MDPVTVRWHTRQLQRATLLPLVKLSTAMGERLWSYVAPIVETWGSEIFLEMSARLIGLSEIESSARQKDAAVLGAWGQSEHGEVSFEVSNGDGVMSDVVGREYLLNKAATAYFTFPGSDMVYTDALAKATGRVSRWTLTAKSLKIDFGPQ